MTRFNTLPTLLALVVVICALGADAATATPPGTNGKIAFRRYFNPDQSWGAVFTINSDGSGARQITHPPKGVFDDQPDWAPDGTAIAFTRCKPDPYPCLVYTIAPDGSALTQIGPCPPDGKDLVDCTDDANVSWSPDSKSLVFTEAKGGIKQDRLEGNIVEHSSVTMVDRDGSNRRTVYQAPPYSADINYPVFSPDGKQILFERDNSSYSKPAGRKALFVINADGTNLRRLTPWAENDGDNPDWSPNGEWILFRSYVDVPGRQSQYFLIHPDGTGRKQITHYVNGTTHLGSGSFSPDGHTITVGKGPENGNIDVYTMRLDGSHVRRLTRSPLWDSAPDWGPR